MYVGTDRVLLSGFPYTVLFHLHFVSRLFLHCFEIYKMYFTFLSQAALKDHQLIHSEEHMYYCDVCHETLALLSTLKSQQSIHIAVMCVISHSVVSGI